MKTQKIIKATYGKFLKSLLVLFMLSWLTLLSSCFFPCGGPVRDGHRDMHERHRQHGHHDHDDHR